MSYIIDARLEQAQPQLRVIDSRNGHCRLQWSGDAVRECLEETGWAVVGPSMAPVQRRGETGAVVRHRWWVG